MTVRVGINGFGRIGRQVFRVAHANPQVEVVAINDLGSPDQMAYLLKHDSNYGSFDAEVKVEGTNLIVDGKAIKITSERNPADLKWGELNTEIVLECTGMFRDKAKASLHIEAGAKKVIVSAPCKDADYTIVLGVNDEGYKPEEHHILSNASCTTNCLAPVAKVLDENFGIKRGFMTTIHAYTNDQKILDGPHKKDFRRARAAAVSIIPTSTGAAKAIGTVLPQLAGKLSGMAMRVPTPTGSIVDLTVELNKNVTAEEVNKAFELEAKNKMNGVLGISYEPLVSVDYIGDSRSSIVDALSTTVNDDNMLKVLSWYDNEWGYSSRMIDLAVFVAQK
ncbi:type I glyceraldehyde-3-phosphate dehydrogenase [Clostridium sp. 'deep sea']|uniref:type I glyceraldehyde-3-phosphate dehydrogenase n=1 Tax=Clostridium sp. 'deep sea' TaxID=2779445 RepID=UPI0018968D50|nr:type I glyceraldehyde-3-phosphate dehydrogenase [Clostridium sp. 'deep sea']QOR34466.1 type I glyceraldehyde-3-phosphate dehydrogenase [Clostridium sp. 'deep sea']